MDEASKGSSPFSAVPHGSRSNAPVPTAVLLPTYHLSSASRLSDQKLKELWKKSPQKKLEQLKKRIQEQKQKQQAASQEQKCLISAYAKDPPQKRPLKRKVCKVASAPPAPVYRGFSAVNLRSALSLPDEEHRIPGREEFTIPGQGRDYKKAPKIPEPGRRFVALPVMENSSREKGNEPGGKSPEFESCMVSPSKPVERGGNAPTKDTKQILRNLHLQSQYHDERRHTRLLKDTAKGKVEVLQQYLGIHSPSPGPRAVSPSAFSGEKIRSSLMKDRAKPSSSENCSRGKSTSPQRQKGSSSPAQKGSEKENLKHPSKRRLNMKKPHPYSPEVVQEFMYRKNEERKKKTLEEKKSSVQAMEMRNKRLQEVYRKQKEAIGKKTSFEQMCKLIRETASAKESPHCKPEQEQTSGGILERSFMAWVDKTSCTLLSKDHRGRSKRDQVKAIHSLSKELAEKIEMATKRLNEASRVKDPADKASTETTLDLFNESSSVPEPETSKDEEDRTMTIQMLLDTPDPDQLCVSSDRRFHGPGRISLAGFPVNKSSEVDTSLLHGMPITSPTSPSHRFLARSPQRELTAQRNRYRCETICKVQNQEEIAHQSPRESLRTPDSLRVQPSATLSPGAETHDGFEQDFGEGDPSCTELEEKHRSHLDNLRQTSLLLAHKLKVQSATHTTSQEQFKFCYARSGVGAVAPKGVILLCQDWTMQSKCGEDTSRKVTMQLAGSLPAEHGEPLHDHQTLNLSPVVTLPHGETRAGDDSGESSEQASSDSRWSEVSRHYGGSSTFCRFSLAMAEQCLRGEELRARHQAALLKLRIKALREKARAELAWLGHQKRCLENLRDSKGASAMAAKQRKILTELKQEQAEIQHLQNIYRAAHQERKLLLKQQREILMMRHSTAQLQEKLHNLAGKQEVINSQLLDVSLTRSPVTEEAIKLKTMRLISSPKLYSSSAESTAQLERPDPSGNKESCVQLKNKQSKKSEGFSTENKKTLVQYQKQAEESLGLEQSLGVQGPDASGMVAKKVCGTTSQTTGSAFTIKDHINTELNAQDHVLLPLECANSARMDEPISTPITREDRKCAFPAGKRKKDLSSDDEDGERRSILILNEAPLVKTPLRKERSSDEQRFSTDSERELEIIHIDEKAPSEIPLSEVKEMEVPVPYEIHQVDGSQCLMHLNHISHEASDEELNLIAFSEGLASTESSSKSNNFSLRCESAKSDSSLPEFQKVSAVWIDISESSISDSESEVKNGEDTDVSIPEEFVYDNRDVFPHVSKEMLIAISNRKETLPSAKHNEHEVPKDDSTEMSSHSQKYSGDVSGNGCTAHLLSFIPPNKANASKTKSAYSSQSDNPAKGMDEAHLDVLENYSRNKPCSQEITKQGKDAVASSSCSDDIYSPKMYEQEKPSSPTSRVKKDGGINSLVVDQNRDLMGFLLTGSSKHLDLVADQLKNTVSLPPDKDITNKLLAFLSSRNVSVSGGEDNHAQLLNETLASSNLSKIVSLSTSMPGISEEVHTETNSFESLQRVAPGNKNNSTTERQAIKEVRRGLFSSVSSKKQLFQAENCSSKGEDDTIFISHEGLPPTDADTLSEILSPVDEILSYGSADLLSSNKKDLSLPSEDLSPSPLGADARKLSILKLGSSFFISPPEQMTVSKTRQCMDEDISLKMDALPPLPDNIVSEEFPLLNQKTTDAFSTQDGSVSEQSLVKDISGTKEGLLDYQQGEHEPPFQLLAFLPVSNPISSGQASRSPDFTMKQCKTYLALPKAEEDSDDPLLSFEIGARVLVKQTHPGTLKFKGRICFDSGHWAGVALDKAEGDNAGTYKGVKYLECAQHCGIFIRPDEISHLLGAKENGSSYTGDEDSDSCDDESFKGNCKYSEDDEQRAGFTEEKEEDTKSAGGSEVKENQSRLRIALLFGKGQKFPHSDRCNCNEFFCHNNFMCLGSDKEKTELTQIKQRILADVLPMTSKAGNTDEVNTSKNICCLVEDQKRKKLADDIASELGKKLLFDTLIAFSETAQHKYKSAFEKDMMNYGEGLRQEDNQKPFLFKENSVAILSEQSAKVSDVLRCDFDMFSIHGCHTVAKRIVTKFVDDAVKEYKKIKRKHGSKADMIFHSSSETSPATSPTFVQGEIIKIMNLEKNDLEMKRKFLNMTKYGNCKRDRVDLILIQELRKEESQWTYYDDDELTVKMRMTEDIFDSLILDTIRVLNKIYLRKACD
ncbi:hypothetical protein QYF61_006376 [Mycteria americana]|uniref:CAP-Gly domain-containing protein n=1 Tax=Mycteria americana TaxID=33587 RepID=A0AAN7RP44_MYCAM|nr:hypothetical protein QYF61_006376 [Mycteria americana]